MQGRQTRQREEDDRPVVETPGHRLRPSVAELGVCEVALLQERPSEARQQCAHEAAKAELVVRCDGGFQGGDGGRVVALSLVEVSHHAQTHREHDRPVDAGVFGRGLSVPALCGREVAVEKPEFRLGVGARAHNERIIWQARVEREHFEPTLSGGVRVTSSGRELRVERVGQCHRPDVVVATEGPERGLQVSIRAFWHADLEVDERPSRQRERLGHLCRVTSTGECVVEPAFALDHRAGQPMRPTATAGDRQSGFGVISGDGPFERAPDVVVLLIHRHEPGPLRVADEGFRRTGTKQSKMGGHRITDARRFAPFGKPFTAVLRKCLELDDAQLAHARHRDDQRLIDKRAYDVLNVRSRNVVAGANRLRSGEVTTAREHRESFEHSLLIVEQQLVAPVDDGPKRLLARQGCARPTREEPKAIVQPGQDLRDREGAGTRCGELNGERKAVEPGADLGDDVGLTLREIELGAGGPSPVDEQRPSVVGGERRHGPDRLATDSQPFTTRRKEAQARTAAQQVFSDLGGCGDDVLAVVEDDQQIPLADHRRQLVRVREIEGERDRCAHTSGIADRG